jgi:hypothetical protein
VTQRSGILVRILAAVIGGYGLAATVTLALPALLPLPRAEGLMVAMMLSFAFCCIAVIWAFAASSAWRAWLGIAMPTLVLVLLASGLT